MKVKIILLTTMVLLIASCNCNKKNNKIYRYYWGKKDGYNVWIVDGSLVRKNIYSSFLYGGNEQRYPFTPKGEIWIDNAISCEEFEMTLLHELNERHLMAKFGWSYDQAHDSSLTLEVMQRRKFASLCRSHEISLPEMPVKDYSNRKEIKDIPDSINLNNIYRIPMGTRDGINIWIVDGYLVRAKIFPDFGFSGNDLSCHFIPSKEIWIDGQVSCEETGYSIVSELAERRQMAEGKAYSDAYMDAVNRVQIMRTAMQKLIDDHPVLVIGDTITRDTGIRDPFEK